MDIGDIYEYLFESDCTLGNPCIGCADYDGSGGCKSNGGCGAWEEEKNNG